MDKMGKTEFIEAVANRAGVTKKDTYAVYEAIVSEITEQLANRRKVSLVGFGNFEVRHRSARRGVNPTTKEKIDIPENDVPKFSFSSAIKNSI